MSKITALHSKKTVPAIRAQKGKQPIVTLTAYTTPMAKILDPHVDILLVGDSLGMTMYGYQTTMPVTLDMMIQHGAAVVRGVKQACVVIDMPFGSYQESKETAYRNAARVMAETGCDAVKLEGGEIMADTIQYLTSRGIAVMGHIGLLPQSVQSLGGYRAQGTNDNAAIQLKKDAKAVAKAGAFSVVIEATVESVARDITNMIDIPTIGIGASPACDGQVLVIDDVLGMNNDFVPRFAKQYANLESLIGKIAGEYADEVRTRKFPSTEHCFGTKPKAEIAKSKNKTAKKSK
ncbi:MAG: 3-methyl-2-oxobutanoate hydroxymethyltransferase [Alphaproteobacteria bacterium]|nr:MAG: 3-methyl-2-oxobutanoate hydroxymethyltransferase [Alphaproteobacteria bacterium]